MAVDRKTPTEANHGASIAGDAYAVAVNEEVGALWDRAAVWLEDVSGTNTLTATADPTLEAYSKHNQYNIIPANTNTDEVTISIDGLASRAILNADGSPLAGGELVSGRLMRLQDDGTALRIISIQPNSGGAIAAINVQVFTATDTYEPHALMEYAKVEAQAAGAGSGGADTGTAAALSSSGGGSSGEYAMGYFSAAEIGASQEVTIGAPGAAGNNTGGDGGNAAQTSFGSLITVNGGLGGKGANGSGAMGDGGAAPSAGSGGDLRIGGHPGRKGLSFSAPDTAGSTTAVFADAGDGGDSQLGKGGRGARAATSANGNAGTGYGSGAGGSIAHSNTGIAGIAGQPGIVIVTEYLRAA